MTDVAPVKEGFVTLDGYRYYWKTVGTPGLLGTIVTLHGGPGATHDYLLPFADLARAGYRVLFYDQIGCGRSDLAKDVREYTVERDVRDLEALRGALELGRIHLIGSSYGGALALAYALEHPKALKSLVSASGLASIPLTVREMNRLKGELPPAVRATMARYEASGDYQNPEYLSAVLEFYRRHLCRIPVWPPEVQYTLDHLSGPKYGTMNGPNEFTIVGTLKEWDITSRLGEIKVPTLVTTGAYDEVTPAVAEAIHRGIPGSELVRFERSSHTAFWEERERYMAVVERFLARHP